MGRKEPVKLLIFYFRYNYGNKNKINIAVQKGEMNRLIF